MELRAPVLIMAHRRPAEFEAVLASVISGAERRVYVFCDGPRNHEEHESQAHIAEVARSLTKGRWCSMNFQKSNLGLRRAVLTAIDWVFESEQKAIILEDDTLPTQEFFSYCDEALEHYREERRIQQISGYNPFGALLRRYPFTRRHLLSARMDCWGWATWSDRWHEFRPQSDDQPSPTTRAAPKRLFSEIKQGHEQAIAGNLDSWAYSWAWFALARGRLSVVPRENLVRNIGFGPLATHTRNGKSAKVSARARSWELPTPTRADQWYVVGAVALQFVSRVAHRLKKRIRRSRQLAGAGLSFLLSRSRANA